MHKESVFCLATSPFQADQIVRRLNGADFASSDISALLADCDIRPEAVPRKGSGGTGVAGGGWGFGGISPRAVPGMGPFIAAGPIIAVLSGAAMSATVGGLAGGLIGMGLSESEATRYEGKLKQGVILIALQTDSKEIARVKEIFTQAWAEDICSTDESGTLAAFRRPNGVECPTSGRADAPADDRKRRGTASRSTAPMLSVVRR